MRIEKIEDKCSGCMLCVHDCVMGVWRVVDGQSRPVAVALCNGCSHCIAICPCDAIVHDGLRKEELAGINRKNLNPDVYRDIVMSRRSIRQFRNEPVPRELIEKVLDLVRYAPTARNHQDVGYIVVTDKPLIEKTAADLFGWGNRLYNMTTSGIGRRIINLTGLNKNPYYNLMAYVQMQNAEKGRDYILHHAPVVILIHAAKRKMFVCDDSNIAAATIINYAHTLGLGTCFVGMMTLMLRFSGRLRKTFGVPDNRRVYATLVMGYPAYRYKNTVSRKKAEVQWR